MLIRISSALRKDLDTIVDGRIVARCHHHAIIQVMFHHIEHYKRCRRTPVHKQHFDSLLPKDLAGPYDCFLGKEPAVIADHHRLVLHMFCFHF